VCRPVCQGEAVTGVLGGRYRLETPLGRGGTATVWRGTDVRLGRPVAVKMLDRAGMADPAARQRFQREARTVAGLAHPTIVAVHDFDIDDAGVPYLVMELVDGDSVADRLADGPLDIGQAVGIAGQVCAALAAAHAAAVVHRDVKPANILITSTGTVKVCDFGIARLQHTAATQASLTGPAAVVGTADYMAPEQAAGDPVDGRADLYALGCVLYAMLTGAAPFSGDSPVSVASQHLHRDPAPVASLRPEVPPGLDALISNLLAKNPADRPADADQVRARLARIVGQPVAPPATPAVPAAAASRPVRGSAAVVSPTRTMPALDPGHEYPGPAPRPGLRLGPAGIAVVALGAAVLAALAVAALLLTGGQPTQTAGPPTTTVPSSTATTAGVTGDPATLVAVVQNIIQAQVSAGQLDANQANDLTNKLDEIARHLAKGETDNAADKVADLTSKLAELRKDTKIDTNGHDAVLASIEQLAASLPPSNRDQD